MSVHAPQREVADGVLVTTHPYCATTTTVVLGADDGCLVVDPGVTAAEIDDLAARLADAGRRVAAGFATHPHWDHLLWRPALGDAPRWATAACAAVAGEARAALASEAHAALAGVDTAGLGDVIAAPLVPPPGGDHRLPLLEWTGPAVEVLAHEAHAPGHAALVVAGALLAGDMLSDVEVPLPDLGAADPVGDYTAALDRLEAAAAGVDVVVPGHGTVGDRRELGRRLAADRAYLDAVAAGEDVDDERLARGPAWLRADHARLVARLRRDRR